MIKRLYQKSKDVNIYVVILLGFILVLAVGGYTLFKYKKIYAPDPSMTVARVIDGDTVELSTGETVRLLCIDAPEISGPAGNQSRAFLESLILNREVRLEKGFTDKDAYGRSLRYIYTEDSFINQAMLEGKEATLFPYGEEATRCQELFG